MTLTSDTSINVSNEADIHAIVESTIQKSCQIATLPGIAVKIMQLCEDPETSIEDMNSVVDTVLAMRLLKLVNSAYYGMSGRVTSIQHAICLLGFRAVKNVAIAASLVKLVRGGNVGPGFDANDLWIHSIAVATAARMLAHQNEIVSMEEAFLAGLLHDMGIVVEMQAWNRNFARMVQALNDNQDLSFRDAENKHLGASHEAFGEGLCKAWKFPRSLQLSTGFHHRPWELPEFDRNLPSLIHVADILAARCELGYGRTVETDQIDPQILHDLGISERCIERVLERLPEETFESQQFMSDGN